MRRATFRRRCEAAALATLLVVPAAGAADLRVAAVSARYDARETTSGGTVLNRENGRLDGAAVALAAPLFGLGWEATASRRGGTVAYDGFTQIGIPLATRTRLRIERVGLSATAPARLNLGPAQVGATAGIELERIGRAIGATGFSLPVTELLRSTRLVLGVDARLPLGRGVELGLEARALEPFEQRLKVVTFGELDDFTLAPRRRTGGTLALTLEAALAPGWRLQAAYRAERLRFGSAPAVTITQGGQFAGFSSYPGSHQRLDTLQIGVIAEL